MLATGIGTASMAVGCKKYAVCRGLRSDSCLSRFFYSRVEIALDDEGEATAHDAIAVLTAQGSF